MYTFFIQISPYIFHSDFSIHFSPEAGEFVLISQQVYDIRENKWEKFIRN